MTKRITISVAQAVIIISLLLFVPTSAVVGAQWKYGLLNRAQGKLSNWFFLPTPASIPFADNIVNSNVLLNSLNAQASIPTEENLTLAPEEDRTFLQSKLDIIFPAGRDELSDEQVSIETLRYVTSILSLKANSGSATKILSDGYAICGGMSISFEALLRLADIPTRYVGLFGIPGQGSHVAVEVYYENQWHLYDPTYGMFFYSEPEYDKSGVVASLNDLLGSSTKGWYLFKVVDQPWIGKYNSSLRSFGPLRVEKDYLTDFYGFPFVDEYRKIYTITFPVAYAGTQMLSFPIDVDFNTRNVLSLGVSDSSQVDVVKVVSDDGTAGSVGSPWLGGDPKEVHTWFIKTPSPGFVRITYYSLENTPPALMLFPLKGVYVVSATQHDKEAEFLLRVSDTDASVQFWSYNGTFWVDAIHAEWLGESVDKKQ